MQNGTIGDWFRMDFTQSAFDRDITWMWCKHETYLRLASQRVFANANRLCVWRCYGLKISRDDSRMFCTHTPKSLHRTLAHKHNFLERLSSELWWCEPNNFRVWLSDCGAFHPAMFFAYSRNVFRRYFVCKWRSCLYALFRLFSRVDNKLLDVRRGLIKWVQISPRLNLYVSETGRNGFQKVPQISRFCSSIRWIRRASGDTNGYNSFENFVNNQFLYSRYAENSFRSWKLSNRIQYWTFRKTLTVFVNGGVLLYNFVELDIF